MAAPLHAAPPDQLRLPIGADAIRRILPHTWPFLFLDRVTALEPGESGTGIKNVTVGEAYVPGHFDGDAIMPGVLVIEAIGQLAGVVLATGTKWQEATVARGHGYLVSVKQMKFRRPARPGDQLLLEVSRQKSLGAFAEFKGSARAGRDVVARGSLTIAL